MSDEIRPLMLNDRCISDEPRFIGHDFPLKQTSRGAEHKIILWQRHITTIHRHKLGQLLVWAKSPLGNVLDEANDSFVLTIAQIATAKEIAA